MYVCFLRHDANKICCYAHPDAPLIEDYRAGDQICSECGLVVGDRLVKLTLSTQTQLRECMLYYAIHFRVIDVGSEWRTFSNEKAGADPSRVGGPENPLLNGSDLSTMIGPGRGDASFDGFGVSKYQNRRTVSNCILYYQLYIVFVMLVFFVIEFSQFKYYMNYLGTHEFNMMLLMLATCGECYFQ